MLEGSSSKKNLTRGEILALRPPIKYDDGRTIQSHKDETDINKIMARFQQGEAISHLVKHEGVYGDFSEYDFLKETQMLARGREIFDELPGEIRREFHQSPDEFFRYVNDPANLGDLRKKLPGLAKPGRQLDKLTPASADLDAAIAIVKAATEAAKPIPPNLNAGSDPPTPSAAPAAPTPPA